MPCSKVSINNSRRCDMQCDKDGCTCISTKGKSCVCLCFDEKDNIVRCDDCKCEKCNCVCDKANCVCISTGGATCVCVCRDENGMIKRCDDCACCPDEAPTTGQI